MRVGGALALAEERIRLLGRIATPVGAACRRGRRMKGPS